MKQHQTHIIIYLSVAFCLLSIASLFTCISIYIVFILSLFAFLITISQTIYNVIAHINKCFDMFYETTCGKHIESIHTLALSTVEKENLRKEVLPVKRLRILKYIAIIIEVLAYIMLVFGLCIHININVNASAFLSILSISIIFFNLWLVERENAEEDSNRTCRLLLRNKKNSEEKNNE